MNREIISSQRVQLVEYIIQYFKIYNKISLLIALENDHDEVC